MFLFKGEVDQETEEDHAIEIHDVLGIEMRKIKKTGIVTGTEIAVTVVIVVTVKRTAATETKIATRTENATGTKKKDVVVRTKSAVVNENEVETAVHTEKNIVTKRKGLNIDQSLEE